MSAWINVKDELPEKDVSPKVKQIKVLTAIKCKNGYTIRTQMRMKTDPSYISKAYWRWKYSAGEVTHWMPLPRLPREEECKCLYCCGNVDDRKNLVSNSYADVYIDENRMLTLQDFEGWHVSFKIYFCPVCGNCLHLKRE